MSMTAAELRAVAKLEGVPEWKAGMAQIEGSVSKFGTGQLKQLAGMVGGAFAVGAVVNFAKSTMAAADDMQDLARGIGIGVESLQALQLTAERAGAGADSMVAALRRIKKAQDESRSGNAEMQKDIKAMGFGLEEFNGIGADKIFERMSRALNDANVTSEEGAAAGGILGRGYQALATVMQDVAESGLNPMIAKLKEANQIMSEDSVAAAATMQEACENAATSIKTKLGNVLTEFAGGLYAAWQRMTGHSWDEISKDIFGDAYENKGGPGRSKVIPAEAKKAKTYAADFSKITVSDPQAADRLARMGGVIGGQTSPMINALQRMEKEQKLTRMAAERTQEAAEKMAPDVKRTADNTEE